MVTIRDVAKLAGVAPITVSRVVNDSADVNVATRARVQKAIQDLHYVPNTLARSFRSRQTNTLALILSDITNPFWTTIARGVEDTAAENGFHVILGNTDENADKEAQYITLLLQRRVDGIIIAPTTNDKDRLQAFKRQDVPCVLIDRRVDGFKSDIVLADSRAGARRLTQHLIGLGHCRIAMLTGPSAIYTARERMEGYAEALRRAHIPKADGLILQGRYKQESGYTLVKELLTRDPRPTAILAANNFLALGALQALRKARLRVPEEMALVGFDDIPEAALITPSLTVVSQPAYDMGVAAARLLLERLSGKRRGKPCEIILETQLIIRQSCGSELKSSATPRNH